MKHLITAFLFLYISSVILCHIPFNFGQDGIVIVEEELTVEKTRDFEKQPNSFIVEIDYKENPIDPVTVPNPSTLDSESKQLESYQLFQALKVLILELFKKKLNEPKMVQPDLEDEYLFSSFDLTTTSCVLLI
ncbi:hypothetical protein HZS_3326, partial [Henneguya salminicola]